MLFQTGQNFFCLTNIDGVDVGFVFAKQKVYACIFGILTFTIPFLMSLLMGLYMLDYSMPASLMLGCIMASNTLIAYPIVGRYGLQKHMTATLSVGSSMLSLPT